MFQVQQTVVVGLGQAGRIALTHLKQRVQQVYRELPGLMLLALDVHYENQEGEQKVQEDALDSIEVVKLPLDSKAPLSELAPFFQWLPPQLSDEVDWRSTRTSARMALHLNIRDLEEFLELRLGRLATVEVHDAMAAQGFELADERNEASVVIVAALDDPVTGVLLDVVYLLRHVFQRAGMGMATTGLLFLPSAASPDADAEALAYAALKEINAYMEGRPYISEFGQIPYEFNEPPFNRGCYLLDTRNERNVALHQEEVYTLAGEWLMPILLSPLRGWVEDFVSLGAREDLSGRIAAYSSFGLTTYLLPLEELVDWCADRLVQELLDGYLLQPESFRHVAGQLTDFQAKTSLRPEDLVASLSRDEKGQPLQFPEERLSYLQIQPLSQLTAETQQVLHFIGTDFLPRVNDQILRNAHTYLQETDLAIRQEVDEILETRSTGGLSLATQFVSVLSNELARYVERLRRRQVAYQARNQRLVAELSRLGPSLEKAEESIPSYLLIVVTLLAGLLGPLVLIIRWLWRVPDWTIRVLGLVSVLLVSLGGIAYTIWHTRNGVMEKRDQYLSRLRDRFREEVNLKIAQASESIYSGLIERLSNLREELHEYAEGLHGLSRAAKINLDPDRLCGEMAFSLQWSVLTPEIMDSLYEHQLGPGGAAARLSALVQETGTLAHWRRRPIEEIGTKLRQFGRSVFAGLDEFSAEDLLRQQTQGVDRQVREMLDKSAPLWTYDRFLLGQLATTPTRTLVGTADSAASPFKPAFEKVVPTDLHVEEIRDRCSLLVTQIRRGLPLFALRRFPEYRRQYYRALRSRVAPLHPSETLSLVQDPERWPYDDVPQENLATTFALACAFDLITRQGDEVYSLCLPSRPPLNLSADRTEAAMLLGEDVAVWAMTIREIEERIAQHGTQETVVLLDRQLREPYLRPWECTALQEYQRRLGKS